MPIKPGTKSPPKSSAQDEWIRQQIAAQQKADQPKTLEETFSLEFSWQKAVTDKIARDIKYVADILDMDLDHLMGWYNGKKVDMLTWIQKQMDTLNRRQPPDVYRGNDARRVADTGSRLDINTPEGIEQVFDLARSWVSSYFPGFRDVLMMEIPKRPTGGGSRGPTAAEIRAQFDLDHLTQLVNEMSQGLVLAEEPNARKIAKAYVDAIVANPKQELDFGTYARSKIMGTARAAVIYKHKPEGISEEQYLQPYVAAFQQMAGPGFGDQLADTATAGARLGASPAAFQQRMMRTSQVQTSSPFLTKMGQRLTNFSEVLR